MPPTVPLTVLSRDERANDPSLRHAHAHTLRPRATSPPTHPPSKPCEPTGCGRPAGSNCFGRRVARPLWGTGPPRPPLRGLGPVASVGVRPAPYGGPGCPALLWGAGATLALVSRDPSWSVAGSGVGRGLVECVRADRLGRGVNCTRCGHGWCLAGLAALGSDRARGRGIRRRHASV